MISATSNPDLEAGIRELDRAIGNGDVMFSPLRQPRICSSPDFSICL